MSNISRVQWSLIVEFVYTWFKQQQIMFVEINALDN